MPKTRGLVCNLQLEAERYPKFASEGDVSCGYSGRAERALWRFIAALGAFTDPGAANNRQPRYRNNRRSHQGAHAHSSTVIHRVAKARQSDPQAKNFKSKIKNGLMSVLICYSR